MIGVNCIKLRWVLFAVGTGLENVYPPENEIQFDKSYSGKDGMIKWKTENIPSSGDLNLISIIGERSKTVNPRAEGIAYAEVESPDVREVKFTLGSNDGAKVWINNQVVYNLHTGRNAVADQEMLSAKFKKGKNRILVKVENLGASWGLYLRVIDPNKDLEIIQFSD